MNWPLVVAATSVAFFGSTGAGAQVALQPCQPSATGGATRSQLLLIAADHPACLLSSGVLAGERLGQLYLDAGDIGAAIRVWGRTLEDAPPGTRRDVLTGAYLETLLHAGAGGSADAARAFERLLDATSGDVPTRSATMRLLAQVASVVPPEVAEVAFRGGEWRRGVSPAGASVLARWWSAADPFPATRLNERIVEHLLRVAVALDEYADPTRDTGYDDRGDLFVRFGEPDDLRAIQYNDSALMFALARSSVGVSRSSFPQAEIWTYQTIDADLYYILVSRGGSYRIGRSEDLLPVALRNPTGPGRRQADLRQLGLLAMRSVYDQLATLSMEYGTAWSDVTSALDQTSSPYENPGGAVSTIQRRLGVRETEWEIRRREAEPPSRSRVLLDTPEAPYDADAVRFRTPDGTTRIDLTWQLRREAVTRWTQEHRLTGTVVENARSSDRQLIAIQTQEISQGQVEGDELVSPVTVSVPCLQAPCAPSVQLDLYAQDLAEGQRTLVGISVWNVTPTQPLPTSGLVLSDLLPIDAIRNVPHVRSGVVPGTPLSLYLEAYGLSTRSGDARVYIEYDVIRRRLGSLLRRTREVPASRDLRLLIRGATTKQYVILATSDWAEADEVEVIVRVRDERTGEMAERSRTFEVL